jgi:uncharacterized protein (DUF58 family)
LHAPELTVPLVPRRRIVGVSFRAMHSARRGMGSDVAGSRPYRPGDDVYAIDWNASARLSSARGTPEFIVRERYAEEAPRVVVVRDRRPEMSLFPPSFPWLSKPEAMRVASEVLTVSAGAMRGLIGYLDFDGEEPAWEPPRHVRRMFGEPTMNGSYHAPRDNVGRALTFLAHLRGVLPAGSFVFVLSDFLELPPEHAWLAALEHRWDVVPIVVQDAVWEQSFPDVSGIAVPFADPTTGDVRYVRLNAREAAERKAANERRWEEVLNGLRVLDLDPVVISSSEPDDVVTAFLSWGEERRAKRTW